MVVGVYYYFRGLKNLFLGGGGEGGRDGGDGKMVGDRGGTKRGRKEVEDELIICMSEIAYLSKGGWLERLF